MATIVLGDNPGPRSADLLGGHPQVDVTLRDGEGATIIASYTDLETLTETVALWVEAREKLIAAIISDRGRAQTAASIVGSDEIVIDAEIVEVTNVMVHADRVLICWRDGGREFGRSDEVVRIRPPLSALGELQRDVVHP